MTFLPFGEFLPDLPAHKNPGALVAENVMPGPLGYTSVRSHIPLFGSTGSRPVGSISVRSAQGVARNFIGTETGLFSVSNGVATNISNPPGYLGVEQWSFVIFGNRVIAAGGLGVSVQYLDLDSPTQTTFLDLPGNPPRAKFVGVIRSFVVLANISVDNNPDPDGVAWSGFNNSEQWDTSLVTQADTQPLRGPGGAIQGIVSGSTGLIFEESSVWRMTPRDPPIVFRFDEQQINRGTPSPQSIVRIGAEVFFYSHDGFYKIDIQGNQTQPIGANRVDRFFSGDSTGIQREKMLGFIDRSNFCIIWLYGSDNVQPFHDRYIAYGWKSDRWATGRVRLSFVGESISDGVSLDGLDDFLGRNVDEMPFFNVDTQIFESGSVDLLAFDDQFRGGSLSGPALPATVETSEFSQEDQMMFVNNVRALVEGADAEIRIRALTRNRLNEALFEGPESVQNDIGSFDTRVHARYHRYRLQSTGFMRHATGIEFEPKVMGRR